MSLRELDLASDTVLDEFYRDEDDPDWLSSRHGVCCASETRLLLADEEATNSDLEWCAARSNSAASGGSRRLIPWRWAIATVASATAVGCAAGATLALSLTTTAGSDGGGVSSTAGGGVQVASPAAGRFAFEQKQIVAASAAGPTALSDGADGADEGAVPECWTGDEPLPEVPVARGHGLPPLEVSVLSFNLFWWKLFDKVKGPMFHLRTLGNSGTELIKKSADETRFDVMGFQECDDEGWLLGSAGLAGRYGIFRHKHCCMAYNLERWLLLESGVEWVAQDRQYGPRPAQWMRLRHTETGRVLFFMNHHGPIPINSGGVCGGESVAFNVLRVIANNAQEGDSIVLVGDFNANEASSTIRALEGQLRKEFGGQAFGGIDFVFSNEASPAAVVSVRNLGNGGSDHDAISAVLRLAGDAPEPPPHLPSREATPAPPPPPPAPEAAPPAPLEQHLLVAQ